MMKEKRKNIIYIGGFELPDKNAAAQRVISNGKILRKLGYNVIYVGVNTFEGSEPVRKANKNYFGFDSWEVKKPHNKKDWFKKITCPIGLLEVITHYGGDSIFAVIPYNYPAIAQSKIRSICKENKIYYVPDITEWYDKPDNFELRSAIKWVDTLLRMRLFNFQADALITTSTYLTKYYRDRISNIIELPTLYDSEAFEMLDFEIKINSHTTTKLIYAGNPFGQAITKKSRYLVKDRLDSLIILLSQLHNINYELNIYGITKSRYLEIYPEHKNTLLGLEGKIIFNGKKSHQEILNYIRQAHFTIFFRDDVRLTRAGFPSKLSESVTCGTPVITNMISNLDPYINDHRIINIVDINKPISDQASSLKEILTTSKSNMLINKEVCFSSKLFDYQRYVEPMNAFLNRMCKHDK